MVAARWILRSLALRDYFCVRLVTRPDMMGTNGKMGKLTKTDGHGDKALKNDLGTRSQEEGYYVTTLYAACTCSRTTPTFSPTYTTII
jgi:hypothetical protein